jgi:AcrR family transcriptional regulator
LSLGRNEKRGSATPRPVGRRRNGDGKLSRDVILERALLLTEKISLEDVSVVRLAAEFDVTPASIRYHVGTREALTAGVIALFFKRLLERWPKARGSWKERTTTIVKGIYDYYLLHPGVTHYFSSRNRFDVIASAHDAEDGSVMLEFLDRWFGVVSAIGVDRQRAANLAVLLLQFLNLAAHTTSQREWPGEQKTLRKQLLGLSAATYPNIAELRNDYLEQGGDQAFRAALDLIISGRELERSKN